MKIVIPRLNVAAVCAAVITVCAGSASAQVDLSAKCHGPIYARKEVSKPAKMIGHPNFKVLYDALGNGISARVTLEVVLCRSGRITDIRVISSQPPKAGEFVAAAVSLLRFKPAELNWHTVSQRQEFEFHVGNDSSLDAITSAAAKGRIVEELDIMGNRRLTMEQILTRIKTRVGEVYSAEQVQKDLAAILATGYFNAMGTRVTLDDGVRGGVRVIFEVQELPLIAEIIFEGSAARNRSAIVNELARQHVDLEFGRPFDLANIKIATRVIEDYFRSQGWPNVKAEASVENLTAADVRIVFKISGRDF